MPRRGGRISCCPFRLVAGRHLKLSYYDAVRGGGGPPSGLNMRLLIIEDDRDAADYLVKAFREVGHVAEHAADGEEGLALASDGGHDVLIVDRMLPKRDGLS